MWHLGLPFVLSDEDALQVTGSLPPLSKIYDLTMLPWLASHAMRKQYERAMHISYMRNPQRVWYAGTRSSSR